MWPRVVTLAAALWLTFGLSAAAQDPGTIQNISVSGGGDGLQIVVEASQPMDPQTQMVRNPDRIVIDFPGAIPGRDLHTISVERAEVRRVRVGLFSSNPPVTRVVLDLESAQAYQLIPSGKTLRVKIGHAAINASGDVASPDRLGADATARPTPLPRLQVDIAGGTLAIRADKASLAEILTEIHRKTGAEIAIPAGAEQEQVVADIGPGTARDVVTALLNGSRFNFVLVGAEHDPSGIRSLLLTLRTGGTSQPTGGYVAPPPSPVAASPIRRNQLPQPPQEEEEAPVELPEQEQPPPMGAPPGG